MSRRVHAALALAASVLVCFLALTGAVLSLKPALETVSAAARPGGGLSVADVAAAASRLYGEVERIERTASGNVIAYVSGADGTAAAYLIDPVTGAAAGTHDTGGFFGFFTELHRSLFMGDGGRVLAALGAAALAFLAVSGAVMLVRRLGGWRHLLGRGRGTTPQRLHVNASRLAFGALLLSALTGVYLSLVTLGILTDGSDTFLPFPEGVAGGEPAPIATLAALQDTGLSSLRELVFPLPGDRSDVFTLTTSEGVGFVDQATGALLDFIPNGPGQRLYDAVYLLHTGEGAWWLGLLLGVAALSVPAMAASGVMMWIHRRRGLPRVRSNVRPAAADTVILVGSEGNSTWGFAGTLHDALTAAGHKVHTVAMNSLATSYPRAARLFVLTATYGDGAAPSSASRFLEKLERFRGERAPGFAVLGFGDRSFPNFCRYAGVVETALRERGWVPLRTTATIDRQSPQAFERWGVETGAVIGTPLRLVHCPDRPRTLALALVARTDYGIEVQAPTAVLRFALPTAPSVLGRLTGAMSTLGRFAPGDLVGVVPPGTTVPRYYSLASSSADGYVEICVRKQPGGLCSEFLHGLAIGEPAEIFVRRNPDFRPQRGRRPIILIGAGTGIAPLVGFLARNVRGRPMYLYWGGRDPGSDFLYRQTLSDLQREGRLTRLVTAFSRVVGGAYVQDRIRNDAPALREILARGAQVLVCGGKEMADGVKAAIDAIVAPLGISVAALKAEGRYLEDIY